jgi:GMP synthase-like glutamine amidotransferase
MKVHIFQHVPFEDIGSIDHWLKQHDVALAYTRFFNNDPLPELEQVDFLVIMGGPMSVNDGNKIPWLIAEKQFIGTAVDKNIPLLGICLGAQLIAHALGARVFKNNLKEIGWFPVQGRPTPDLCFRFPDEFTPFHWHGETFDLPSGAVQLARSRACEQQAFQTRRNIIGLQFHLEATPESIAGLIEHGRSELNAGTYVQREQQLRSVPAVLYRVSNALMDTVLNYLFPA